ncbi:unnamed protein product [Linum trigynum]|uniref:Phytocyanin domain-containing protein n=1 Tax=Linum trigynum TaxID=586398 RepID=A0AAV2EG79_9ROSI
MAASFIIFHRLFAILISIFFLFFSTLSTTPVSSLQFQVGGSRGWAPPPADGDNYYDQWATNNRFHVGDWLSFVYRSNESDSVLLVNSTAYTNCIVSDPILQLNGGVGNATFQFDRPGLFYFISGKAGSCIAGQKLVVRVMAEKEKDEGAHHDHDYGPSPAPGANNGDLVWDWPPAVNSTVKMTIASYFITALAGVLVILYLLM